MNEVRKHYILDTNVLVSDPLAIYKFHEHEVVLPIIVIEELDHLKNRQDQGGQCARQAIRELETLRAQDPDSFKDGVDLPNGGRLRIELNHTSIDKLPTTVSGDAADNRILATAYYMAQNGAGSAVLVTKDANLRIKAGAIGVEAQEYRRERVEIQELYTGQINLEVAPERIDDFYTDKQLELANPVFDDRPLFPNQLVILTAGKQSAVGRAHHEKNRLILKPLAKHIFNYSVQPKNIEQEFALELLMDPKVDLVTLSGPAGTGKTLLALMAGMELVVQKDRFSRLLVSRPVIPMGRDIGFLPGSVDEKMSVWLKPFKDNLEHLLEFDGRHAGSIDYLFEEGIIEVGVLSYIRGRSIPNQFILIDECQNLERSAVKSVLTRVGANSHACLTGDLSQIDHPLLDTVTNGLTHVIESLKEEPSVGHITLTKGVRSDLATLIAERL